MSLLPSLIRSGVGPKLQRASDELAKAEASLADLRTRLAELDAEQDDFATTAQSLNAQISVTQKSIGILSLQIAGLEHKLSLEQAAEQERKRVAAVAKIEKLLPRWMRAAEQFEAWLKSGDTALAALTEARREIVKSWPDEIERPYAFFMDLTRAIRMLRVVITPSGVNAEAAAGYAEYERELMAQLLAGLKDPPAEAESEAA